MRYVIGRIIYSIPILIGVNFIVFIIFFTIYNVDDLARLHLGDKRVSEYQIQDWKKDKNLDLPLFYNKNANSFGGEGYTNYFFPKVTKNAIFFFWQIISE